MPRRLALLGALVTTACGEGCAGEEASSDEPVLVSEDEARALSERVDREVERNRDRSCPRPVLRGEAREGSAEDAILDILAADGDLARCFEAVPDEEVLEEVLLDEEGRARSPSGGAAEALARAEVACEPFVGAIERAVAYEDACSPFLPGRRGHVRFAPALDAARAAVVLARARAEGGAPRSAAELLLDVLRFGQDLARGGTSFVEPMISVAQTKIALPHLAALLRDPALGEEDLQELDRQLETLIDSRLRPTELHRAYYLGTVLHFIRPALEGPEWEPPGGAHRVEGAPDPRELEDADPQFLLAAWSAVEDLASRWSRACPDDATWRACVEGLDQVGEEVGEAAAEAPPTLLGLVDRDRVGEGEKSLGGDLRRGLAEALQHVVAPSIAPYFRRLAWQEAAQLALRHKLTSRLDSCPAEPLEGRLGASLEVEPADDGAYRVRAPAFAFLREDGSETGEGAGDRPVLTRVHCDDGEDDLGRRLRPTNEE